MMKTPDVGRLVRTLGPLPVAMHGARLVNIARKRAWRPLLPALVKRWRGRADAAVDQADCAALRRLGSALVDDVAPGAPTLLAETLVLAGRVQGPFPPADWSTAGAHPLQRYEASYLEWFDALISDGSPAALELAAQGLQAWRHKAPQIAVAWEPYPRARRALACLRAASRLAVGPQSASAAKLQKTALHTAATATFALDALLERHLDGNHLLVDHFGLAAADAVFGSIHKRPADWLARATTVFEAQLHGDGAHVEASPMYHALLTEDALNVALLAGASAADIQAAADRAVSWMAAVAHPDGTLPAFGDTDPSTLDACPLLRGRLANAEANRGGAGCNPDPHASVFAARSPSAHVVVHTAQPAWTNQPGHAHDDALSVAINIDGRTIVADAGLCGYEGDKQRPWNRSAAAHSTVQLDGAPGIELWGAFRVGERGAVDVLDHSVNGSIAYCLARHRWPEDRHSHDRLVAVLSAGAALEGVLIADTVATGRHVTARLRLSHGVAARPIADTHAIIDPAGVHLLSNLPLDIRPDRRFPQRGREAPCQSVVYHPRADHRSWLLLSRERAPDPAAVQSLLASITARW